MSTPAVRGESRALHRDWRCAWLTRRDEREYRQYSTEEQRREPGCSVSRMQHDFHHGLLGQRRRVRLVSRASLAPIMVGLLAVSLMGAVVPVGTPEDVGLSATRLQRINQVIQRAIDANEISGAVTLVSRRGQIAHFEAQGLMDIEAGTPMRKDTIFPIASMSKPITGVAVLMLVEAGKVRLTDPVSRFIPEFTDTTVAIPKAAARAAGGRGRGGRGARDLHRASHSRDHRSGSDDAHVWTGERRRGLGERRHGSRPGGRRTPSPGTFPCSVRRRSTFSRAPGGRTARRLESTHSDASWEVASGLTFDEFLRQRIFEPLGMTDTAFFPTEDRMPRVVTLYSRAPGRPGTQTGCRAGWTRRRCSPVAAGSGPPPRTICGSPRCSSTAVSWTERASSG